LSNTFFFNSEKLFLSIIILSIEFKDLIFVEKSFLIDSYAIPSRDSSFSSKRTYLFKTGGGELNVFI